MLNTLFNFTVLWKLEISLTKTKCVTFTRGNKKEKHSFTLNNRPIENTIKYKYLGITIHKNGSFNPTRDDLANRGTRAIFALNKELNLKFIPIRTALMIFKALVIPILTYGSEIWSPFLNQDNDKWEQNPIEKVHSQYLKQLLGVNRSTTNVMVKGDLGLHSLQAQVFQNHLNYMKYVHSKHNTLVTQAYIYERELSHTRISFCETYKIL